MNVNQNLVKEAKEFIKKSEVIDEIKKGENSLKEFHKKFNFRESPEKTDQLAPEDVYNPAKGETDYFFNWIEQRLRSLGAISVRSADPWKNAADKLDKLKDLLKIAVDDSKPIAEKIDANWEEIPKFGGDKHIAKKIVSSYYPEEIVPIFNTEHIEKICGKLGISIEKEATKKMDKNYADMSVGEKWEFLNELLLEAKGRVEPLKDESNPLFSRFLYETFDIKEKRAMPGVTTPSPLTPGFLFEPKNELGVVSLFSKFHNELGFPYIVKVSGTYPDMTVMDVEGNLKSIEFEFDSRTFAEHEHDPKKCDYVVCWEDNWENPPSEIEIVSLKKRITKKLTIKS